MISDEDWIRFNRLKYQRFAELAQLPVACTVMWHAHDLRLFVDCPTLLALDAVQWQFADLKVVAWVVLGADELAVYLAGQPVWEGRTSSEDVTFNIQEVSLVKSLHLVEPMEAAVLERAPSQNNGASLPVPVSTISRSIVDARRNRLPGQTLENLALDVEQSVETIRAWLEERSREIVIFENQEIVSGATALAVLDHFFGMILDQRKARRGLLTDPPLEQAAVQQVQQGSKNTEMGALRFPSGYEKSLLKGNTRQNLMRALPANFEKRQAALEQIATESEWGKQVLNRISELYAKKFGQSLNYSTLLNMARKIQSE